MNFETAFRGNDTSLPAAWRVLTVLLQHDAVTQAELRAGTGLSHPIIVQQVGNLRQAGLITRCPPLSGKPGRPRVPIAFNWDFRRLLVAEVSPTGISLQATNLYSTPQGEVLRLALTDWSRDAITDTLLRGVRAALATPGAPWAGIGITLPGCIDADGQQVTAWSGIPEWRDDRWADLLSDECGVPVRLFTEADALSSAAWMSRDDHIHSLTALCLCTDGRLALRLRCAGVSPTLPLARGDFGQIPVADTGPANEDTRCLEALLRAAREHPALRPAFLHALAQALIAMVTVLDPDLLALQGDAVLSPMEMLQVGEGLRAHSFPARSTPLIVREYPAAVETNLCGVAGALSAHLLDLRTGALSAWITAGRMH